jgi:hypothetical protein
MEPNMPNLKLKLPRLPKALGELAHSNQFLKVSAIAAYGLCLLMVTLSFFLARKQPLILAFTPKAVPVEMADLPQPEDEVIQAVKIYVEHRYKWEPKTVVQRLHEAEAFIQPQSRKAFEAATAEVAHFSIDKGVVQRAYLLQPPLVDLDKKAVLVMGDRVTAIQGLKAAGELRLELSIESGPRTKENPWGIYITKEKEQ